MAAAASEEHVTADPPSPSRPPEPSWEGVAAKLLREKFLLTALELYVELEERGRGLPTLTQYFSNPAHFEAKAAPDPHAHAHGSQGMLRSSSQTTLDSLDWGRLSEDGERAGDERIAVLEFELRKARETIQGLRATLTHATEQRLTAPTTTTTTTTTTDTAPPQSTAAAGGVGAGVHGGGGGGGGAGSGAGRGERSAPAPHERRMLNFLVNEYLASASYKLTAITFADENDEDFEHWDDVGLNTSRPPSLVELLRDGGGGGGSGGEALHHHHHHHTTTTTTTGTQTEEEVEVVMVEEVERLKDVVERQERELNKLHHHLSSTTAPSSPAPDRTQGEGRPTTTTTLSPGSGAGRVDAGRESPEGTSDSEGAAGAGGAGASGFVIVNSPMSPVEAPEECPDSIEELLVGTDDRPDTAPLQTDSISDQLTEIFDGSPLGADGDEEGVPRGVTRSAEGAEEGVVSPDAPPAPALEEEVSSGAGQHLEKLVAEARRLLRASSKRKAPEALEERVVRAGLRAVSGRGGAMVIEALADWRGSDLVGVVARTLPRIAPNVILAKREELVPLVVAGAGQQGCAGQREVLLTLLFGLLKRPDEDQRGALLAGLGVLARTLGPPSLEAELLPHVWEHLAHRRPERRLLVAAAVGTLAPHTPAPLRNSLLLSMLLQLLAGGPAGERDPQVREAALTSLALVTTFLDDPDKLPQLVDVAIQALRHPGPAPTPPQPPVVPSQGLTLLLGALASWSLEEGRLGAVVDPLMVLLQEQVGGMGQPAMVACTVQAVASMVPFILASLITSMPGGPAGHTGDTQHDDTTLSVAPLPPCPVVEALQDVLGCPGSVEGVLHTLHQHLAKEWLPPWPHLDYLTGQVLPGLVGALAGLEAWPGPALDAFLALFCQLPRCLGPALTTSTLTPLFLTRLDGADPEAVRHGATGLTGPVAVVYAAAILGRGGAESMGELEGFLGRQVSILGLCGASLDAPLLTVATLMAAPRQAEAVLAALWASVVHRSPAVRAAAAHLWGGAVAGVAESALGPRVVPALVTLASDPDMRVKAATLTPLATVITTTTTPEVVDKVWLQLESLADDVAVSDHLDFQLALAHTCTHLAHTSHPKLIQQFLLPRMCRVAMDGGGGGGIGAALLEAYSALTCCNLPDHVIAHFVLPPLQQLQKTLGCSSFESMETLTDLIREYTIRTQTHTASERRKSSTLSLGGGLPAPPNVEEVRTKMSKMFSTRPSSSSTSSSTTSTSSSTTSTFHARAQAINASLPGFLKKK